MSTGFTEIEHTADYALRITGRDFAEMLVNAARGMVSLMVTDPAALPTEVEQSLELDALDAESMLVEWLNELAYWAEIEGLVFHRFELHRVTLTALQATVRGGHTPELQKHIKAVTFHNLQIIETDDGLETTVVFDV
jgi:SHS2 domain-containing protein